MRVEDLCPGPGHWKPEPFSGGTFGWAQHPEAVLYWVDTCYACGGVLVWRGYVVGTCPIYRKLLGKPWRDVPNLLGRSLRRIEPS